MHKQFPPPYQPWNMSACKHAQKKTTTTKKTFVGNHIEHGKHWHHSLVPQHVHLRRHQYIHAHTWLCSLCPCSSFIYLMHTFFYRSILQVLLTSCTIKTVTCPVGLPLYSRNLALITLAPLFLRNSARKFT